MPRRNIGKYKCRFCGDGFATVRGLHSHASQIHKQQVAELRKQAGGGATLDDGDDGGSDHASGTDYDAEGDELSHDDNAEEQRRAAGRKRLRGHASGNADVGAAEGASGATSSDSDDREHAELRGTSSETDSSEALGSARSADDSGSEGADAVVAPAAAAALPVPQPALGAAVPVDTGIHARRKVPSPPCSLSIAEQVVGGLIYEHVSNSVGDALIAAFKRPDVKPSGERGMSEGITIHSRDPTMLHLADLPDTAAVLKERIVKAAAAEQPLFQVASHRLTYAECEEQPPRKNWRGAAVANRGVLASLVSALTNQRTFDWERVMHYNPDAPPPHPAGEASEPFYTSACQEGCKQAIARGRAMGWTGPILPAPALYSSDAMSPAATGNDSLIPLAIWLAPVPLAIRRAVTSGEHVMLFPSLPLGKTRTPRLTRDHRAAVQEGYRVFTDEFNALHRTGFRLHGSHILNCPYDEEILVMPFALGGSFDAVCAPCMGVSCHLGLRLLYHYAGGRVGCAEPEAQVLLRLHDGLLSQLGLRSCAAAAPKCSRNRLSSPRCE